MGEDRRITSIINIIFVLTIPAVLFALLAYAYALCTLWGWFIVPMGAEKLSFKYAIGVVLILSLFLYDTTVYKNHIKLFSELPLVAAIVQLIIKYLIKPLAILAIGFVIHMM